MDTSAGISVTQSAAVTASSLGTTLKDRSKVGTITVTFTGNGSKTKKISVDVYQAANTRKAISTSGGTLTYSDITAGTITNATIPAKGGSATATAGVGKQSWQRSQE